MECKLNDLTTYRKLIADGTARIDLALKSGWTLNRSISGHVTLNPPPHHMIVAHTEYDIFPYKYVTFGKIPLEERYECIVIPHWFWNN